jgi:hypothetical protein
MSTSWPARPGVAGHFAVMARDNHQIAKLNKVRLDQHRDTRPGDLHHARAAGARVTLLTPQCSPRPSRLASQHSASAAADVTVAVAVTTPRGLPGSHDCLIWTPLS